MKKLSFIDFLGFAGIAVAILAVYITFTFVKAYNPTTPEPATTYPVQPYSERLRHTAAHPDNDTCMIKERIYLIFGGGDSGEMVKHYLLSGEYTDQLGNPCSKSEFEQITGIDLETYPL
jgi:hypothetical protein